MRVCPQCTRKNKPRAKFCDQCGFEFLGYAGAAASTKVAGPRGSTADLPPNDTAKGLGPAEAGIPEAVLEPKGVYRETQKLNSPVVATGTPAAAVIDGHQTVKIARMPASNGNGAQDVETGDPEPDATIQGAFYLRKQSAAADGPEEHVGWLVAPTTTPQSPGAIWPVTAGLTYIGSDPAAVGPGGVTANRPGLEPLHALLFHRDGQTWLVDLATPMGSIVNGDRLPPLQGRLLDERDEIRLGELVLSFRRADPQRASRP